MFVKIRKIIYFDPDLETKLAKDFAEIQQVFLSKGPEELKNFLRIKSKKTYVQVFDYLVLRKGILNELVKLHLPFFCDLMENKGPDVIRKIFKIEAEKYDEVYFNLLDLLLTKFANSIEASGIESRRGGYSFNKLYNSLRPHRGI